MKNNSNNPGLILVISYFLIFLANSLVIILTNLLFPNFIVLGTACHTKLWAIIQSMGVLALINTLAIPLIREYENKRGKMLNSQEWMLAYFLVNFAGLWIVARFAKNFGLGISSWVVALVLAIVLDAVQSATMIKLEKFRTK
ncbi:MAG: hypothetical protein ABIB61_04285 [Candidatus Shapirobacteria bacterium]